MNAFFIGLLLYSNIALAEPGFWQVAHEKVPEKVKLASKNVYEVYLPGPDVRVDRISNIPQARRMIRQRFSEFKQLLANKELDLCEQQQVHQCFYTSGDVVGATMFALEDGRMASVVHPLMIYVQRQIYLYEIKTPDILKLKIPAVIRLQNNQFVSVFLKIDRIKKEMIEMLQKQIKQHPDAVLDTDFDGVIFSVEGFKPQSGLKIAGARSRDGENIYALGFPAVTSNRSKFAKVPDSNGKGLFVTMGKEINLQQLAKENSSSEIDSSFNNRFVIFKGDGAVGMSGGPIVNANGEVVGITHSIFPNAITQPADLEKLRLLGMDIFFLLKD